METDNDKPEKRRIKVHDKRRAAYESAPRAEPNEAPVTTEEQATEASLEESGQEAAAPQTDYNDLYLRLLAEFDNFKKRTIREKTELIEQANARLIERLLPVLDHFGEALKHHPEPGFDAIARELYRTLESEGLEEIASEGEPFDPRVHEAVESHEEPGVVEPTCKKVYFKGYRLKGQVLRPARVVVALPVEEDESTDEAAQG